MSRLAQALASVWFAHELPGFRDHPRRFATYSAFPYAELPPLPEQDEGFAWLEAEPPHEEWSLRAEGEEFEAEWRRVAGTPGLVLPHAFTTFLTSPNLQHRVRSVTACYLDLANHVVTTVGTADGFLIHFLSDQQGCLHWYLHVNRAGEEGVLVSPQPYGFDQADPGTPERWQAGPIELENEQVAFCAPTFSAFLHRFWLESEIWWALNENQPLTDMQRAYAEHYTKT